MGQISNVLFIVAITAVMAVITSVLAIFFDLLPSALQGTSILAAPDGNMSAHASRSD